MGIIWFALSLIALATPGCAEIMAWNFYETALTRCANPNPTFCVQPSSPHALFSFIVSGATSAGHADAVDGAAPLIVTGDPGFSFHIVDFPRFSGTQNFNPDGPFHMSWDEVDGQLLDVHINYLGNGDTIDFGSGLTTGLTGGFIASDAALGGCYVNQCVVAGYWEDPVLVPEPSSLALFGLALIATLRGKLAAWLAMGRRARKRVDENGIPETMVW